MGILNRSNCERISGLASRRIFPSTRSDERCLRSLGSVERHWTQPSARGSGSEEEVPRKRTFKSGPAVLQAKPCLRSGFEALRLDLVISTSLAESVRSLPDLAKGLINVFEDPLEVTL